MRSFLFLSLLATACSVGEVGGADTGGANGCVDRIVPPGGQHTHLAGGGTNAGMNCIVAGCHLANNPGTGAPGYQFAGTVYVNGTTNPSTGLTVQIKSGAMTLIGVTDAAGNFSFPAGSLPGNFMATAAITACPTVMPMTTQLIGGGGAGANSCNLCHAAAGGTTTPIVF